MHLVKSVKFDSSDQHIERKLLELEGWGGIRDYDDEDPIKKSFRRLRGNSGSVDDIKIALGGALEIADQQALMAETAPCPFPEIPGREGSVEEDWRNGLRMQANLIRRHVETIASLIDEEIPGVFSETPDQVTMHS